MFRFFQSQLIVYIFSISWIISFSNSTNILDFQSADYLYFQILLIFNLFKVSWLFTFPKSAGYLNFQTQLIVYIFKVYCCLLFANIFIVCCIIWDIRRYRLKGRKTDRQTGQKNWSLEVRADAFSCLKKSASGELKIKK